MKTIAVCLEHRFYEFDNKLYTKLAFTYPYWKDYLNYFDEVVIIARVQHVNNISEEMVRVDGPNVKYEKLFYYHGLKNFLVNILLVFKYIFIASKKYNHFLLRSGNSTNILWLMLMLSGKPYLREYPGNIKEGMIGLVGNKFWVRVLANFLDSLAKLQAKYSNANSFVSDYCKKLYGSKKPSFVFSSFRINEISSHKSEYGVKNKFKIACLGRLEGEKGHLNLLKAIQNSAIENIELHLIGGGSQFNNLKKFAEEFNIDVIFYGAVTDREKIFNILENCDLYIISSLTEGMPRSLLEAMAIGLPCIGSNVGGIPEVMDKNYIYDAQNIFELSNLIKQFYSSEVLREEQGLRNINFIQKEFGEEKLLKKKKDFWSKVYE